MEDIIFENTEENIKKNLHFYIGIKLKSQYREEYKQRMYKICKKNYKSSWFHKKKYFNKALDMLNSIRSEIHLQNDCEKQIEILKKLKQ